MNQDRKMRFQAADKAVLRIVGQAWDEAARRAGPRLKCEKGCSVCCFGPFPITAIDAWRLGEGLAALESRNPETAAGIRERAGSAVATLRQAFPGEPDSGRLRLHPEQEATFAARLSHLPCPALDPDSGGCLLYEHRPVACRLNGPALKLYGDPLPHCPLCFKGSSAADIEAARVTVELDGRDGDLVRAWESAGGEEYRTVIAYALHNSPPPEPAPSPEGPDQIADALHGPSNGARPRLRDGAGPQSHGAGPQPNRGQTPLSLGPDLSVPGGDQ